MRETNTRNGDSQSKFAFVDELFGADQPTDSPGHSGIPEHVLQEINRLADAKGFRARDAVEDVLWLECPGVLGATARRLFVEAFFAIRAERLREFLDGLGLSRNSDQPDDYGPGTWMLTEDRGGRGRNFVLSGIRNPSGESISVRLKAREFNSAAKAWRAVQRAIGSGEYPNPPAAQWRRLWSGFNFKDAAGWPQRAAGIRAGLWAECVDRPPNEGVLPPDTIVGGSVPSCMLAPLPRAAKQKTRREGATSDGHFSVDAERLQASSFWRGDSALSISLATKGDPDDSRDRSQH